MLTFTTRLALAAITSAVVLGLTASGPPHSPLFPTAAPSVPKPALAAVPLDLDKLTVPEDVWQAYGDVAAKVPAALEKFLSIANGFHELQKGSHVNDASDLPMFEPLRPLMSDSAWNIFTTQYQSPQGTNLVASYGITFWQGWWLNDTDGYVMPDDAGMTWRYDNDSPRMQLEKLTDGPSVVITNLKTSFLFRTVDRRTVDFDLVKAYYFRPSADGTAWILHGWSSQTVSVTASIRAR